MRFSRKLPDILLDDFEDLLHSIQHSLEGITFETVRARRDAKTLAQSRVANQFGNCGAKYRDIFRRDDKSSLALTSEFSNTSRRSRDARQPHQHRLDKRLR